LRILNKTERTYLININLCFDTQTGKLESSIGEYFLHTVPLRDTYTVKIMRYGHNGELIEVRIEDLEKNINTEARLDYRLK
jgi:hypothetical protein